MIKMTKIPKIAVILFPGTNCELETKLSCEAVGTQKELAIPT